MQGRPCICVYTVFSVITMVPGCPGPLSCSFLAGVRDCKLATSTLHLAVKLSLSHFLHVVALRQMAEDEQFVEALLTNLSQVATSGPDQVSNGYSTSAPEQPDSVVQKTMKPNNELRSFHCIQPQSFPSRNNRVAAKVG